MNQSIVAIMLAGGRAERMWPLTKYIPKALLPIAGKPVIDFALQNIVTISEIEKIIISIDKRFENHFRNWYKGIQMQAKSKVEFVTDPFQVRKKKLGSIGAIQYLIKHKGLEGNSLLIIAGDNLFSFSLTKLIEFYRIKGEKTVIAFCDFREKEKIKGKFGVGILGSNENLIKFQEKPIVPKSTLVSTGCYIFPPYMLNLFRTYLNDGNNSDDIGYFITWLYKQTDVYGYVFSEPWYDIGSLEVYDQINNDHGDKSEV